MLCSLVLIFVNVDLFKLDFACKFFFKWLFEHKVIGENPAEHLALPKIPRRGKSGISEANLKAILAVAKRYDLPVVEDEKLLGVISFRDVAKAVLEEQDFENKMLKGYIKNWPA